MNVRRKKIKGHKVYRYSKANWKDLNYDLKNVDWTSIIGSNDPHQTWPLFRKILSMLCDKHIPKKSVKDQFLPPWYDSDCDKVLREKEKWRKKANSSGSEEHYQKYKKLRQDFKKIMEQQMRLNVIDKYDNSMVS